MKKHSTRTRAIEAGRPLRRPPRTPTLRHAVPCGRAARRARPRADLLGSGPAPARSATRSTPTRSRRPPTASPRASTRWTSAGRRAPSATSCRTSASASIAGETFLIAGERFAIGSSREMSPAGLKGVAEEKGLELVVVCSHNMGDIFRRNAFNLGLHVVQSPGGRRGREGRRRVRVRSRDAEADQRNAGQDVRARSALGEGGGDPVSAAASSPSAGGSSATPSASVPTSASRTPTPRGG